MINRRLRSVRATAAAIAAVAILAGCASSSPAAEPTKGAASTSTTTATPTPEPQPLLVISGTVADHEGQSLAITLTTTSVRAPTEEDRADYAATRCAVADPSSDPLASPDARVVTMAVEAVGSSGFTGWTDARGARVAGSVFDGSIWEPEAHAPSSACYQDSRITRPGTGEVRMFASSDAWNLDSQVTGDAAITLAMYGLAAVTVDALGQPTGLTEVTDCVTTASATFDTLATHLWDERWGRAQNLPEYCFYGRSAGD